MQTAANRYELHRYFSVRKNLIQGRFNKKMKMVKTFSLQELGVSLVLMKLQVQSANVAQRSTKYNDSVQIWVKKC